MSARSASARKRIDNHQKTKAKAAPKPIPEGRIFHDYYYDGFYNNGGYDNSAPVQRPPRSRDSAANISSWNQATSPPAPAPIEREESRADNLKRGLVRAFGRKKDKDATAAAAASASAAAAISRPESGATTRQLPSAMDAGSYNMGEYGYSPSQVPRSTSSGSPVSMMFPHGAPMPQGFPPAGPHGQRNFSTNFQDQIDGDWPAPPPATKLPPIPTGNMPPMRRWLGGGRPSSRWNKLRRDPELWDPHGDVLVYLGYKETGEQPNLRLSSHAIEATRKRFLVTKLREGFVHEDAFSRSDSSSTYWNQSQALSDEDDVPDADVSFEMCFPPPPSNSRVEMVQYQMTVRNMFALIFHKSLVGFSVQQALLDLHSFLDRHRSPGEPDATAQLTGYISARGLDDVRGQPDVAVSILAWAERQGIQWARGWRESFIHCAGMNPHALERVPDWRHVTPLTKAHLERSWLEMRMRVQSAEERLGEFSFDDMWSGSWGSIPSATAPIGSPRAAADRLRNFLIGHYGQLYGTWPPSPPATARPDDGDDSDRLWLTRDVARALQQDFGALYDYLVDRDIAWDVSEARAGRKWMMASKSGNMAFDADEPDLPMTDVLIEFDNRIKAPHVPHPHPMLPQSMAPQEAVRHSGSGGMFKTHQSLPPKHPGHERKVALAYTETTNLDALGRSSCTQSALMLVDAFTRFEKSDYSSEVDPRAARQGRWVLLYGILQVLATVSVDAPGIKHHEGVSYHLSAKLKRPAWTRERGVFGDAKHEMSHCWLAPQRWAEEATSEEDEDGDEVDDDGRWAHGDVGESSSTGIPMPLLSPPAMSTAASERTESSARTSSSVGINYSYRYRGAPNPSEKMAPRDLPPALELPLRQMGAGQDSLHDAVVRRQINATPSMSSMGSLLLALEEPKKRTGRSSANDYSDEQTTSRGVSPVIRDFDEEP